MLWPLRTRSSITRIVPYTARPTRQVRPTILPAAVADAGDAVQRALDAGAVVVAELADALDHVLEVVLGHFSWLSTTSRPG